MRRWRIFIVCEGLSDVGVPNEKRQITIDISNDFVEAKTIIYFLCALTITSICSKGFLCNISIN